MIFMSSSAKRWIIFIIFLLSIIMGYRMSDVGSPKPTESGIDIREAENVFQNSIHTRKTRMNFAVSNFQNAIDSFNEIISAEGIKQFYRLTGDMNIVSVIEISASEDDNIITRLRNLPGLENEKTETIEDISHTTIDTPSHLEQNRFLLQRYRERLNNPYLTTREISELQLQIRDIQTRIDSLYRIDHIKAEQEKQNHLVMAVIRRAESPGHTSRIMIYIDLAVKIIFSFVTITIIVILLYFGIILLLKLMEWLGVKSSRKGLHYLYRYQKYGSDYRSGHKGYIRKRRKSTPSDEQESITEPEKPKQE